MRAIRRKSIFVVVLALSALAACAYRRPIATPPASYRLRVAAPLPEQYGVHVWARQFAVASDGNVVIEYPATSRPCDVYLFDRIPIRRSQSPFRIRAITVVSGGRIVRRLSLEELLNLPKDPTGTLILAVP